MGGNGSGRKLDDKWAPEKGTEAWERQTEETDQAWTGFVTYRDMAVGRTLAKATELLGKKPGYLKVMEDWSRGHHWRLRVVAWDSYKDAVSREAELEARREAARDMVDRHLQISTSLQRLTSVEILRWINYVKANIANPDMNKKPTLQPNQIKDLLDYGVKLERLNRDKPTDITENRVKTSPEQDEERIDHLLQLREEQ